MPVKQESPAVNVARAHVQAWSNHDFGTARTHLAADVTVTATTTQPFMKDTNLAGIDDYMAGLEEFARGVVPGSARVIASVGDERNALLMLTVEAVFGPGAPTMTLPAARLYLLDDSGKIKREQVIFYAVPG